MTMELSGGNLGALIISYVATFIAVALVFVRLIWRHRRGERMYADDIWMGISLGPLLIRLGMIHMVLEYGTNNIDYDVARVSEMDPDRIHERVIGSKLILASRVAYAGL